MRRYICISVHAVLYNCTACVLPHRYDFMHDYGVCRALFRRLLRHRGDNAEADDVALEFSRQWRPRESQVAEPGRQRCMCVRVPPCVRRACVFENARGCVDERRAAWPRAGRSTAAWGDGEATHLHVD